MANAQAVLVRLLYVSDYDLIRYDAKKPAGPHAGGLSIKLL